MDKKYVLVIGGSIYHLEPIKQLGLNLIFIQKSGLLDAMQKEICTQSIALDYEDLDSLQPHVTQLCSIYKISAVCSFTEAGLLPAAHVASWLNIASNCNLKTVNLAGNKTKMREMLAQSVKDKHCPSPVPHYSVQCEEKLAQLCQQWGYPIIVKPEDGVGSLGVIKVDKSDELDAALSYCRSVSSANLIAEKYIGGLEYSVECFSNNGQHELVAITEKITTGAPNFVEMGHNQPAQLSALCEQQIASYVSHLLNLIGLQFGPSHTEVKVHANDIYIIETQPRPGGDSIWEMVRLTTGVDFFKETVAALLNIKVERQPPKYDFACVNFFFPDEGVCTSIEGYDKSLTVPGIFKLSLNIKAGDLIEKATCSPKRTGFVLAVGADRDAVHESIRNMKHILKINTLKSTKE
jgi:biotin carboxylase